MIENAANLTLDELRTALAPAIADSAIFDGWSETALLTAAEMEGVDPALARLAFKPRGRQSAAMAMVAANRAVTAPTTATIPAETGARSNSAPVLATM